MRLKLTPAHIQNVSWRVFLSCHGNCWHETQGLRQVDMAETQVGYLGLGQLITHQVQRNSVLYSLQIVSLWASAILKRFSLHELG